MRADSIARRLFAVAVALGVLGSPRLTAQTPGASEYEVKAAYLYNFGRFIQWPASVPDNQPFGVCVVGRDPFGEMLDATLKGASLNGSAVALRRLARPHDASGCRIVFISESESPRLKETLAAVDGTGVLTVSDIPDFAQRGGAIQFVIAAHKVRFEINLTTTQNAGLVLSSDLLKVAMTVRKTGKAGD